MQEIIISFPSTSFAKIEGGAINKWGKPDNTGETLFMQKANGASGTSTDDSWTLPDGSRIFLSSRHDGTHGQLMLRMP